MDWLILILGVPAILIPLVLLFGFAGCASAGLCTDDSDCPGGLVCVQGACVDPGELSEPNPAPPSAPENLAAIALDDHSVSLTWTNNDLAARDFQIERTPEDGGPVLIPAPDSPTGTTDASGLQEGVTYIYRVQALVGSVASEPSDTSSATVFPAAPVNLIATPVSFDRIDLSWTNASTIATEFSLEHRVPGGVFAEIPGSRGTGTTFSHTGDSSLAEGTPHEYRVFAIVVDGVEDDVPQEVKSAASLIASATTLAFTAVFTAPPGILTNEANNAGRCVVQRLSQTLLARGGNPTQVRILLRGPLTGSVTLDKVTISQAAAPGPGVDLYDSGPDLTDVASGVTLAADAAMTVGPVNYRLDATKDLIIAFDISNTPGEGNVRFGALTGADAFSNPNPNPGPPEAGVQDRTPGYSGIALNTLALIELIEVL
jgi:hypothetical protein